MDIYKNEQNNDSSIAAVAAKIRPEIMKVSGVSPSA